MLLKRKTMILCIGSLGTIELRKFPCLWSNMEKG